VCLLLIDYGLLRIAVPSPHSTELTGDKIIVLDQGHVAESGSHGELLDRDGHYAKMWREQKHAENEQM